MSMQGVSAVKIADAILSESANTIKADPSKAHHEALASSRSVLTPTSPTSYLAVSAEELTFQFSEVTEAKETALEERLDRQRRINEKVGTIKVEQIQAIMKLMEGKEGYDILRGQARSFATLYRENPEIAIKQLELANMQAEKRYALMNMALDTLSLSKDNTEAMANLENHIQQQNNPFQQTERLQIASLAHPKNAHPSEKEDLLFQAISIRPSIKGLWDLINEKSNGKSMDNMGTIHFEWNALSNNTLAGVGAIVIVHRIMTIIQTIHTDAEKIMSRIGAQEIKKGDRLQKHTKMLIDLAQSSMPSTLIDKIIDYMKSTQRQCPKCALIRRMQCKSCAGDVFKCNCTNEIVCHCTDFRRQILSLLYLHARQWPQEVWSNVDAKNQVLDQLLKKQNAPNGLLAKRMLQ